ncbi:putative glyoxalase family protein [Fonsecaea pedrosoi]|nr:putative glyoxalase family protein [Fonsecaea pedrosoi]
MPAVTNALANHIAISVSDGEAAVKWYKEVLGLREIVPLQTVSASGPDRGPTLRQSTPHLHCNLLSKRSKELTGLVYGPGLEEMKLAILSTGNGVGIEIFEFTNPPYKGPSEPVKFGPDVYARGAFFHVCFTVPDVKATAEIAVKLGGRICGEPSQPLSGIDVVYLQDPWGNTLEFLPLGWEQLWLEFLSRALQKQKGADAEGSKIL